MISLAIIAVLLIIRLVAVPYLLRKDPIVGTAGLPDHDDPCLGPMFTAARSSSSCPETVLCADLLSGRITRERYRSRMAALAAQDAARHPLVVPSEP